MGKKQVVVYLAGAMEAAPKLGADWRSDISEELRKKYNVEILNPCEFEAKQLEGLVPTRLPEKFTARSGDVVKPEHWHQFKYALRNTHIYRRFRKYIRLIIQFDCGLILKRKPVLIVYWTPGVHKGSGTQGEITLAFLKGLKVYCVVHPKADLPAWANGCCTEIFDAFDELYDFLGSKWFKYRK